MFSDTALEALEPFLEQPVTGTRQNRSGSVMTVGPRATQTHAGFWSPTDQPPLQPFGSKDGGWRGLEKHVCLRDGSGLRLYIVALFTLPPQRAFCAKHLDCCA